MNLKLVTCAAFLGFFSINNIKAEVFSYTITRLPSQLECLDDNNNRLFFSRFEIYPRTEETQLLLQEVSVVLPDGYPNDDFESIYHLDLGSF